MEQGKHEVGQRSRSRSPLGEPGTLLGIVHFSFQGAPMGPPFGEATHLAPTSQESAARVGLSHLFHLVLRLFHRGGGSPPWNKENMRWNK